jgi:hypothetical protein
MNTIATAVAVITIAWPADTGLGLPIRRPHRCVAKCRAGATAEPWQLLPAPSQTRANAQRTVLPPASLRMGCRFVTTLGSLRYKCKPSVAAQAPHNCSCVCRQYPPLGTATRRQRRRRRRHQPLTPHKRHPFVHSLLCSCLSVRCVTTRVPVPVPRPLCWMRGRHPGCSCRPCVGRAGLARLPWQQKS